MLTATLQLPDDSEPLTEGWEIGEKLNNIIDWVLDAGHCGITPTSVIDLTGATPEVIRIGAGDVSVFQNL